MNIESKISLMEQFTKRFVNSKNLPKSIREIHCMESYFPTVFTEPETHDYFVGRFIMLPIGHGLEWAHLGGTLSTKSRIEQTTFNGSSVPELNSAGPSYYGVINQLQTMMKNTEIKTNKKRLQNLIQFWSKNDTHTNMVEKFKENHNSTTFDSDINNFLPPILVLTRLSGLELDYEILFSQGIEGLRLRLLSQFEEAISHEKKDFLEAGLKALHLLERSITHYISMLENLEVITEKHEVILTSLKTILNDKPDSFHSAMQLMYIYSQLAGVVNYGRMDDYIGPYLVRDLNKGLITEDEAIDYTVSMWHLINDSCNRGNGRVIIGGVGRRHPSEADTFCKIAIKSTMKAMLVKPQLTLRLYDETPNNIYDLALDSIGKGCTFPMLYNDNLNVEAVSNAMNVPMEDAEQYVPYGCGEYIINARGTGSPNVCVNFTKALQLALNSGVDPFDHTYRGGDFNFRDICTIKSYEDLRTYYYSYLDYILETTVQFQHESYQFMAEKSSFIFPSLLMHDCIKNEQPILDGGVRYYSGVNEFYGFTNAIDSLQAIKTLVYDNKDFTLSEFTDLILNQEHKETFNLVHNVDKFGNDLEGVDSIATDLHNYTCNYIRDHAKDVGLHSFLAVNINNNANTRWGLKTGPSFDGRVKGEHLAPGNNPHSGRDKNGITAMLNSISKLQPDIHAGYVQNLKCSPNLFNNERTKIKYLFEGYFNRPGGTQIMVNVVNQKDLVKAQLNPEQYQHLIVRCGGFSAKFIELDTATQNEIINRTCNI